MDGISSSVTLTRCSLQVNSLNGPPRLPENKLRLRPMALHSGLSMTEQMEVFEPSPPDSRKVVVATNIAEVSPHPLPHPNLNFAPSSGEHYH